MKRLFTILAVALALVSAWSCKKDKDSEDGPDKVLLTMTEFTSNSATFQVKLTTSKTIVRRGLFWLEGESLVPSYDDTQHHTLLHPVNEKNFTMAFTGLLPGTAYCVRAFMEVEVGDETEYVQSDPIKFWTLPDDV